MIVHIPAYLAPKERSYNKHRAQEE